MNDNEEHKDDYSEVMSKFDKHSGFSSSLKGEQEFPPRRSVIKKLDVSWAESEKLPEV